MTAPVDEAGLRRLAEAAAADRDGVASDDRAWANWTIQDSFVAAANPHQVLSLLDRLAALRAERDEAVAERDEIQAEWAQFRLLSHSAVKERDDLAEALRFYAERDFYEHPCDPSCCEGLVSRIEEDGFGDRARAALARLQDGGGT